MDKTLMAVRNQYYWHKMIKDIRRYVMECTECQQGKSYNRYKALLKPLAVPSRFVQTLHMDHIGPIKQGPNGEKYIFTVIDSYSTWPWLFGVRDRGAETTVNCLFTVVKDTGAFKTLISDNAASFVGKMLTQFCKLFDIKMVNISAYSSSSNEKLEQFHSSLANALQASITLDKDWLQILSRIDPCRIAYYITLYYSF